nr:carboxymuconolactone decarboxylase family protein [Pseudanabaena sp. PCC 6802]
MAYKNAVLDDEDLKAALMGINPKFGDFCIRAAGEAWGLPLISQKTKALITIAIDVVNQDQVGTGNPFGAHVTMAIKQGATRDEVEEVLLFACIYAGFNKAAGCFGTLNDILGPSTEKLEHGIIYNKNALSDTGLKESLAELHPQFGDLFYRLASEAWGLPIISIKDKAFLAIAIDIANQDKSSGVVDPFVKHTEIAARHGATRAEIEELITFTCVYTGFNKGVSFFAALQGIPNLV